MKAKIEIRQAIKEIQEEINGTYNDAIYKEFLYNQLRALRWVLGYKNRSRYWCPRCEKVLTLTPCSKCGGSDKLSNASFIGITGHKG